MNNEHPISDDVLDLANAALFNGKHWMAFNSSLYFIDKNDVHFFKKETEANEFANNNSRDRDFFDVMHLDSIQDIFRRIPYGKELKNTDRDLSNVKEKQLSLFNSQLKTNIMNYENLQYLTDNIKYMGFGENLKSELEKNMNEGKSDFQLFYTAEINKKSFEATLNFRKSDTTDMYFFNNYHASLEKTNGEKMEQTFYINKGKGVTSKEAFNLLDGRAVHKDLVTKEGEPYKAWMQLDTESKDKNNNFGVKQYHENYGFDLKAAVEKFSISELKDEDKEKALMQSLQKGNIQSVTIEKDGNSHKMFIEADPQFKKINLYDSQMKIVPKESIEQYQNLSQKTSKEDMTADKKKELKQDVKPEKEKLANKNDKSLLPKKRESTGKGLGVA